MPELPKPVAYFYELREQPNNQPPIKPVLRFERVVDAIEDGWTEIPLYEVAPAIPRSPTEAEIIAQQVADIPEPWEFYGMMDDQRCFFCGEDKRDYMGQHVHDADCTWALAQAWADRIPKALLEVGK